MRYFLRVGAGSIIASMLFVPLFILMTIFIPALIIVILFIAAAVAVAAIMIAKVKGGKGRRSKREAKVIEAEFEIK